MCGECGGECVCVWVGASVCIFECANVGRVCVSVCILNVCVVCVWCGVGSDKL